MTKQTEALKLALAAFETLTQYNIVRANIFRQFHPTATGDYVDLQEFREKAEPAITALREALAEQPAQQEPVAWMNAKRDMTYLHGPYNVDDIPLYTSQQPAQQECRCNQGQVCHVCDPIILPVRNEPDFWHYTLSVEGQVVNENFTTVNWDTRVEPFGRYGIDHGGKVTKQPLYTSPPAQRKPLTDAFEAFKKYLEECDERAIVPDVAGAFNSAWKAAQEMRKQVE